MMNTPRLVALAFLLLATPARFGGGFAADSGAHPPTSAPSPPAPPPAAPGDTSPPAPAPGKPQPYDQVITKEAKSNTGLLTTHTIGDKYYFEIPVAVLGKDLLWVTSLERSQNFYGFGTTEVSERVIRFERRYVWKESRQGID